MVSVQAALLALALGGGETVLLDFSAAWCGPCRQMEPTVAQLIAEGYPIRKVDIDRQRELAARYQISGVPCFVMLVDGQEVDRIIGGTSRQELERLLRSGIQRPSDQVVAASQAPASPPPAATQQPAAALTARAPTGLRIPSVLSAPPLVAVTRPSREQATSLIGPVSANTDAAATPVHPSSAPAEKAAALIAASVRLKIDDAGGRSVGSGTIIDARSGEALILTCGHVFRDSQGKGKIYVDLFGSGAPQNVPARLIGYDLKADLGLLSIRTATQLSVAPLAAADYALAAQQRVTNVGCNHGAEPTARASRITSINKYLGPANVQVAGQPVEGRSGGGLFNDAGEVIGVCNAADPADNEGLYAALPEVYAYLDRLGLRQVLASATGVPAKTPSESALASMPERMPSVQLGPAAKAPTGRSLNVQEATVLGELSQKSEGAEVICIVRSLTDPRAKSEIIVLDRASPDFLETLAADRQRQEGRRLTSWSPDRPASASRSNGPWEPVWKTSRVPVEANAPATLEDARTAN